MSDDPPSPARRTDAPPADTDRHDPLPVPHLADRHDQFADLIGDKLREWLSTAPRPLSCPCPDVQAEDSHRDGDGIPLDSLPESDLVEVIETTWVCCSRPGAAVSRRRAAGGAPRPACPHPPAERDGLAVDRVRPGRRAAGRHLGSQWEPTGTGSRPTPPADTQPGTQSGTEPGTAAVPDRIVPCAADVLGYPIRTTPSAGTLARSIPEQSWVVHPAVDRHPLPAARTKP